MKVTGEVKTIPTVPSFISNDERAMINSVTDFWFGAEE
jgi:hypothetical protein